jgi:hypothetical protein
MSNTECKTNVETHQIAGHCVEISTLEDREELRIDGVRTRFFVTDDGYNLNDAAFDLPYESLLDAVKAFLETRNLKKGGN